MSLGGKNLSGWDRDEETKKPAIGERDITFLHLKIPKTQTKSHQYG